MYFLGILEVFLGWVRTIVKVLWVGYGRYWSEFGQFYWTFLLVKSGHWPKKCEKSGQSSQKSGQMAIFKNRFGQQKPSVYAGLRA